MGQGRKGKGRIGREGVGEEEESLLPFPTRLLLTKKEPFLVIQMALL